MAEANDDTGATSDPGSHGRLAAMRNSGLLPSTPNDSFDRLTRLAAGLVRAKGAFISILDGHLDVPISRFGLPGSLAGRVRNIRRDLLPFRNCKRRTPDNPGCARRPPL